MSVVNASIHSVLGGFEIEVFVNLILYGIICVQAYIYALSSKRDPTLLRTVVAAIWSLETLHIGLLIHSLYQYAIIGFGRLAYANILIWDVGACMVTETLIISLVQSFFISRIHILGKLSLAFTLPMATLLAARISFGLATAAWTYKLKDWTRFRSDSGPLVTLSCHLGISVIVDIVIASSLIRLYRRNDATTSRWNLYALTKWAIVNGVTTSLVVLATTLTLVFLRNGMASAGLIMATGKLLYSNSMLAALNSRVDVVPKLRMVPPGKYHSTGFSTTQDPIFTTQIEFEEPEQITQVESHPESSKGTVTTSDMVFAKDDERSIKTVRIG